MVMRSMKLTNLTCLDHEAPDDLDLLDVAKNNLTDLPNSLRHRQKLTKMVLDENNIENFPHSVLKKIPALIRLSFSKQRSISQGPYLIPRQIHFLQQLLELHLENLNLQDIPEGVLELPNLVILELGQNRIASVPDGILKLSRLEYLGLCNNCLSSIPNMIGKLSTLKVLRLSNNCLEELPNSICDLTNLQTLSIRNNRLVRLPTKLYKLNKLLNPNVMFQTMHMCFKNEFRLDRNHRLIYPRRDDVEKGPEAVFEYLKFYDEHPEVLP